MGVHSFRDQHKYLICLVTASGLYTPSVEKYIKNRFVICFFRIMTIVSLILFITFFLSAMTHLLFSDSDFLVKTYDLAMLCGNTILLFKLAYYNIYRHRFEKLFTLFDTSFEDELFLDRRLEIIFERKKKIEKLHTILTILSVIGCLFWAVPQFFDKDKKLSHPVGWPYRHQSPDFELLVTSDMVTAIYAGASGIGFDMVLLALLTMEEIQLVHLKKSLAAIVTPKGMDSQEVEISQEKHEQYSKLEWLKESELLRSTEIEKNIRIWIRQHQKTMRIHQELRNLYYYPLCVQFINIVLTICVTCFLRAVNALSLIETTVAVILYCGSYSTFYMNCKLGDKINETSATIFEEAFWKPWYIYPEHVKKIFHIIIMTTQRPLDIVAFDIYPLGARSFFKIFKTGYTFFMFLMQTKSKRHHHPGSHH